MNAIATTTVSILGGASTDEYGDPVDNSTVQASGIPASIIERVTSISLESGQRPQAFRYFTGRLPSGTTISTDNRVRDDTTNEVFIIDAVTQPRNPIFTQDLNVQLRRIT